MERRQINPWTWQDQFGFSHGIEVEQARKMLFISGQVAINENGQVECPDDILGQIKVSLDHLELVLEQAGFTAQNLVRVVVYTTDVDRLFPHWNVIADRLKASGGQFACTLLGVQRLAFPELLVEIEATAVK